MPGPQTGFMVFSDLPRKDLEPRKGELARDAPLASQRFLAFESVSFRCPALPVLRGPL